MLNEAAFLNAMAEHERLMAQARLRCEVEQARIVSEATLAQTLAPITKSIEELRADPAAPLTRLRRVAPSLYDLRQAWEGADSATAVAALLAFLTELDTVTSPAELDTLDRTPPASAPSLGPAVVVVSALLGLASWACLIAAIITGAMAVIAWTAGGTYLVWAVVLVAACVAGKTRPPVSPAGSLPSGQASAWERA
jgi:hypothetical protein